MMDAIFGFMTLAFIGYISSIIIVWLVSVAGIGKD